MEHGRLALAGFVLFLALTSGCLGFDDPLTDEQLEPQAQNETGNDPEDDLNPQVVVASIDRGWNPYHEAFQRPNWDHHPSEAVPELPEDTPSLELTFGDDYQENLNADQETLENLDHDQVYWVEGTNLLFWDRSDKHPSDDDWEPSTGQRLHGTGASAAVATACEACYVLVVIDPLSGDGETVEDIALNKTWVNFVSMTSMPGSQLPGEEFGPTERPYLPNGERSQLAAATRTLHGEGGLFFAASGNTPVTVDNEVFYPGYNLPPWVVDVGGVHSQCQGSEPGAGSPAELVGDFAQDLPSWDAANGTDRYVGTSFATPQVAGTFGETLARVLEDAGTGEEAGEALWSGESREGLLEDGLLTSEELREALSLSASYFETADFRADCLEEDGQALVSCATQADIGCTEAALNNLRKSSPVSPSPWVEMGWGYPGPEAVEKAVGFILGEAEEPEKPEEAHAWMEAYRDTRETLYPWEEGQSPSDAACVEKSGTDGPLRGFCSGTGGPSRGE